jgi:hypothetical protein
MLKNGQKGCSNLHEITKPPRTVVTPHVIFARLRVFCFAALAADNVRVVLVLQVCAVLWYNSWRATLQAMRSITLRRVCSDLALFCSIASSLSVLGRTRLFSSTHSTKSSSVKEGSCHLPLLGCLVTNMFGY